MTGWQRFGLMLLCYFGVMVLFPDYDAAGFYFAGITLMMWTGVILVLAVINNILGLYNFPNFCRFITLVFIAAVLFSLLWYFPQKDNVTPINKLKYGEFPTMQDIKRGVNRFTFNFDFVRRRATRPENFINQELEDNKEKINETNQAIKEAAEKAKKQAAKKIEQTLEIEVE
ncbi:hypothetical protein [Candidatus Avelusimicrobium aviculae]|uniref:hypothetical protein n=1 Tax=Candidatus Avelusimicrobium aviculae TaxID=3416206 RepID=UPI003D0F7138